MSMRDKISRRMPTITLCYPSTSQIHSAASYYDQIGAVIWGLLQPMYKNCVSSQRVNRTAIPNTPLLFIVLVNSA